MSEATVPAQESLTPQQLTEKLLSEKPEDVKELEVALGLVSAQQEALKRCMFSAVDAEIVTGLIKHLVDTKRQLLEKYLSHEWVVSARAAVEAAQKEALSQRASS